MAKKSVKRKSAKPAARKKSPKKPVKKSVKKPAKKLAANVVVVPGVARGAYNPNRPLAKNTLLLNQVRHFQEVENQLPQDLRTGHDPKKIRTEGHAAEYVRKMTSLLHPQAKPGSVRKAGGK